MKELKKALAIQGLLMLAVALLGFSRKNRFLNRKESFLFGLLGLTSLEASGFLKSGITMKTKHKKGA